MLKLTKMFSVGLCATMLMFSCSKDMEDVTPTSTLSGSASGAAKPVSTANNIAPLSISSLTTTDGKTWSFTVQKDVAVTENLSNIGSLLLTMVDCEDMPIALSEASVASASITGKNGAYTQPLTPSYKEGNGSACDMSSVNGYIRLSDFEEKLTDGSVYTVNITLNDAVRVKSGNVWARISNGCYYSAINGAGCSIEDLCGYGQGYFHKSEHWPINSIVIGGKEYSVEEAVTLITSDKKEGGSDNKGGIADSKAAFAQGVTVLLNRKLGLISPTAYAAQLAEIEAYLSTLDKLTTYPLDKLPTNNETAKTAAGYIGDHIDCEGE